MSDKFNGSFLLSQLVALKNSDEGVAIMLLRPHSLKVLWHLAEIINWPKFITDDIGDAELLRDIRNEIYTDNSMVYIDLDGLLIDINTTLQERLQGIEDAIKQGGEGGDGSGNTIQDLIFWLKILLAVSGGGGGLAPETTTPFLSLINSSIAAGNLVDIMGELNQTTLETKNNAELELIADKLQALVDKTCPTPVQSVRLPKEVIDSGYNLLKNGSWLDGQTNGIPSAFYPDYWLVVGNAANDEYPGRTMIGGVQHLVINGEASCIIRQSALIPPGYGLPKFIMTWAGNFIADKGEVKIYVNNELIQPAIVEESASYLEMDFNAVSGDTVKVELTNFDASLNYFGVAELFVYADELTVTQQVTLPTIGGSLGKGRNRDIKPDKRQWVTTYNHPDTAVNWIVDKLETLADWFGLHFKASKTVAQSLTATRIFRVDSTTKLCNIFFNTSIPEDGAGAVTVDVFNDTSWETIKTCTVSSSYAIKADFGDAVGEKLIRISFNPSTVAGGQDFWFYDLQIEEID